MVTALEAHIADGVDCASSLGLGWAVCNCSSTGPDSRLVYHCRLRMRRQLLVTEARVRGLRSKLSKKDAEFKSSRDLSKAGY